MSMAHPHPEPRTYPLMLRTWTYVWWRPVVGILMLVAGVIVAQFAVLPVVSIAVALDHHGSFNDALQKVLQPDTVTWQSMLYLNLTLAVIVPVTWVVVRVVHRMRPRWLMSVKPGIRWRFFWACFGLSVVAILAQIIVGALLPSDPNDLGASANDITSKVIALAVVILLTTPLQAMGEEYGFRGYLMQAFGALTRRPWIAVVVSAALFALAHGIQNAPLFLDRFAFGLMAGYLVFRTGGLEAGIAMHIWNNLVAFGFALLIGNIDDSLNVTEISWWNIPLTIIQNGLYLVLVLLVARRMGISNTTSPPVESPVLVPTSRPV
jgi:membrane protease YdiL (CAAX protease family)